MAKDKKTKSTWADLVFYLLRVAGCMPKKVAVTTIRFDPSSLFIDIDRY